MKKSERRRMIKIRTVEEALCLYENKLTVRQVAKRFGLTKSPVYKDLTERLPQIMREIELGETRIPKHLMERLLEKKCQIVEAVDEVLQNNKAERHIRGGEATKQKYSPEK